MSVCDLIAPITAQGGPITLPADRWLQGRTLYGGASALVAYTAAVRAFPDLPPLRAGQVGFVAPVGPHMETRAQIVRQGRNVAQVRSELVVDGGVALTAFWLFGTEREANAVHPAPQADPWPGPPENNEAVGSDKGPPFIRNNYEIRRAQDEQGRGDPIMRRWFRLREPGDIDLISQLILVGDTLPPGAVRAMQRQGPISSINWSFNILDARIGTRDGWWLGETASQHADAGYSSERLRLWNADGVQVMDGLQSVAVFG